MNLEQLIAAYRLRSDDRSTPPHVSDADLALFASEAEREACIRARLIFDSTSGTGLTQYAVTANQAVVDIHPLIDIISAARFQPAAGGKPRELELTGLDWIQDQCDWQGRTSSRPCALAHLQKQVRIWPMPSVAGTLYLDVYRLPLSALEDPEDDPEIDEDHHDGLVDWMLFRVYSSKDGELEDPKRAADALALFEERFGERPSADVRRRHRERRRVTTRCL